MDAFFYDDIPGGSLQGFPNRLAWKHAPNKVVVHSTEGTSYPGYNGGNTAPHCTIDPWAFNFRQHYGLDVAGWALKAPAGLSTNTAGAVQFEIIGTCDPRKGWAKTVTTMPDENLAYVASVIKTACDRLGIPWASTAPMVAYPASYGLGAGQRLSAEAWYAYRGLLGHQHVPGNLHGDPGAFPIERLLALGLGSTPPPAPAPAPTPTPQPSGLVVDGQWGKATTKRLQEVLGTPADGEISHQWKSSANENIYSAQFDKTKLGSTVAREMQRRLGLVTDGLLGSASIRGLQAHFGTPQDGVISPVSTMVKEMQTRLNGGSF